MYFWCFGFRGELGFLNCDDVCMCVVNKQFELLEFVSESVYVDLQYDHAQKTVNRAPIAGGGEVRHNLHSSLSCDSSTACRLCRLEPTSYPSSPQLTYDITTDYNKTDGHSQLQAS